MSKLRAELIKIALEWEKQFGVAPRITSAISEYDAAMLVGCTEKEYSLDMQGRTAVNRGFDFKFRNKEYQVKGNRPSGKPGSKVTRISVIKKYEWDFLIWILYNVQYEIVEAWMWNIKEFSKTFNLGQRISPANMRKGKKIK